MRTRALLLTLVGLLFVAGCTGDDGDEPSKNDTAALQSRLTDAREAIDSAESVEVSLSTEALPDGVRGLLNASGVGNHTPAFDGTATVVVGGSSAEVDVRAVDGSVWAKGWILFNWTKLDPTDYGIPDPAGLLDTETGITQVLGKTEGLAEGKKSRDGETVLTSITGTIPGTLVQSIIPSAKVSGTFDVTYRLTEDDVLHDVTLTGPFYAGSSDVTYRIELTTSDEPVTIKAP